jgi:hypothetical protein
MASIRITYLTIAIGSTNTTVAFTKLVHGKYFHGPVVDTQSARTGYGNDQYQ